MSEEEKILSKIGMVAANLQLAEECCELAQVCFKKIRALCGVNPTRKTMDEIDRATIEEYTDVFLSANVLGINVDSELYDYRIVRWMRSLDNGEAFEVNAKWIQGEMGEWRCSNCGYDFYAEDKPKQCDMIYCPKCGRKMI